MFTILYPRNSFGEHLLLCREHQGMNIDEAAATVGVHGSTWRMWENGKCIPMARYARNLALLWGIVLPLQRVSTADPLESNKKDKFQDLLLSMIGYRFTLNEMGTELGITRQAVSERINRDPVLKRAYNIIRERKGLWLTSFHPAPVQPRFCSMCHWNEAVSGNYRCVECNRKSSRDWVRHNPERAKIIRLKSLERCGIKLTCANPSCPNQFLRQPWLVKFYKQRGRTHFCSPKCAQAVRRQSATTKPTC